MTDKLSVADVLDRAAALIEPEGAWTQGVWARGPSGKPVTVFADYAVCFCMRGALVRAANTILSEEMRSVQDVLGFKSAAKMAAWNDREGRTQAEVVSKLREAANLARERGL